MASDVGLPEGESKQRHRSHTRGTSRLKRVNRMVAWKTHLGSGAEMGTRRVEAETVYAAAEAWVERALRSDDSLFTPGRRIWRSEWLDELHRRFLNRPDVSEDSFLDKLERQLTGSPPEAFQLMAEVLYVHFLIVSRKNSTRQQEQLDRILGRSPEPVAVPSELAAGLVPGLANPGRGFHSYRPFQVGLIIEFASQWKQLGSDERQRLLDDPWAFKDFVIHLHLQSAMFRDHQQTPRSQRQALLHLVHPDTFEKIVNVDHKNKIAAAFEELVENPATDVDRKLQQIRSTLERTHEDETFSFYSPDIRRQWDDDDKTEDRDQFVESAEKRVDADQIDSERPTEGDGELAGPASPRPACREAEPPSPVPRGDRVIARR